MNTTQSVSKQKQMVHSNDLMRSFKASTSLAKGLTKERITVKHDLLKISHGKEQLEELKNVSKKKEPIQTAEEKATKENKADIKFTGFNMQMTCSQKGKEMIERQQDIRRQRHIEALKEAEKYVTHFYDTFCERKNEIKERIKVFFAGSDVEIDNIMNGTTDELLLANEIAYVNGIWEKVNQHREARKEEMQHLRASFDDLKNFQKKGSGGYLDTMRSNLINIAFILEPEVDKLLEQWVQKEEEKYIKEHEENDEFYKEVCEKEKEKFDELYQRWKESVVRFHFLKQEDAIKKCLDRLNSKEFVNNDSRVNIFNTLKSEQQNVFKMRMELVQQLKDIEIQDITKECVSHIDDQLKQLNEDAQASLDKIVESLAKDMENTNEDADILVADLKDFLIKNDAQLEDGQTFESIIEERVQPTVDRRKLESKTLITNSVKYMEDQDYHMNEISQNIVIFFKELATKLDANKDKLKQTEMQFQIALAQCGDNNDEQVQQLEDELQERIEEMRKAIHHVELNERLQVCFDMLDKITKQYRDYNTQYIEIVNQHPTTMDNFYNDYEKDCASVFKMYDQSKREEIQALFQKETEERQKKLEDEALKKYEDEKQQEELKKAQEDKNKPPAKGGAKPPQKKGKEPEKPQLDVPKLEVPEIQDFETYMGNKYLIERSVEEISQKIIQGQDEQEKEQQEKQVPNQQDGDQQQQQQQQQFQQQQQQQQQSKNLKDQKQNSKQQLEQQQQQQQLESVEGNQAEEQEEPQPKFEENDYLEKAEMKPPVDPEGNQCLIADLVLTLNQVKEILESTLDKTLTYLNNEKTNYEQKVQKEGKELIDQNVDELDENLRKQWPRKGKLEVEVYQERKSQISAHIKKYERQVRTCLEKFNNLQEQWNYVLETIEQDFTNYKQSQEKIKTQLPDGKNLAEIQGCQRKEKDSVQTFEEKCREFQDQLYDIAQAQPDMLTQQNETMLKNCQLFEQNGNYSQAEIDWYRGQMKEIDDMIIKWKQEREEKLQEVDSQMEKLIKEPYEQFEKEYKTTINNLSAKEGLGKTFGQPRRLAQEKMRSEMAKCESAQKGVDELLEKLNQQCEKAQNEYHEQFDYSKEPTSLSMEIRINLVTIIRCILHYGNHLGGFSKEPKNLQRISYREQQQEIELTQEEQQLDEKRKEEELQYLGSIGFKNATQQYLKFQEAMQQIEKSSKELCTKLYTGENAKFLVGPDKIPEYLQVFLEHLKVQCEDFRISQVRQLRESALKLVEKCQQIPKSVFGYLGNKYSSIIKKELNSLDKDFNKKKSIDDEQKESNLKMFRPNLENPANKVMTQELNEKETNRTQQFQDLIDEVQLNMLDIEQDHSNEFYNAFLNNVRGLIKIYDCLLYKEDFIMLPGDEIIEKKHQNIKVLTAQAQKQDIGKRATRKWDGLGQNPFEIDFANLFEEFKDFKKDETDPAANQAQTSEEKKNEISSEVEVLNTEHHKAIIKQRNQHYNKFKTRFQDSIQHIMKKFNDLRKEEIRFNEYWQQNLKEITQKHI